MFTLQNMRARVRRLEQFAREVAAEVELIRDAEQTLLLPGERRQYLNAIQDVIAGAEAARVVMQKAVRRLERSELSEDVADDAA
jgi:hypothetical protein